MSINPKGFLVILEGFAKRYYCKDLAKKPSWDATWQSLEQILSRFDPDALAGKLEPPIKFNDDRTLVLYKMMFRLADEHDKSAKTSGHRMIFVCDFTNHVIRVLLVYHKRHVKGGKETAWWTGLVNDNYSGLP